MQTTQSSRRTQSPSSLARRRSRQRGAAMAEALVAIPFFIIIFASTMFVGQVYKEKLATLRQSRKAAWAQALPGCAGSGPNELKPPPDSEIDDPEIQNAPGSDLIQNGSGKADFTATSEATASNIIGGIKQPLKSRTVVMCNEEPKDGNLWGVAKYVWDNWKDW